MLPFLIWIQILSINAEQLCARPGEKVEIPCRNERKLPKVKWSYYTKGAKFLLTSSGADGVKKHNADFQSQFRLTHDNSLVIEGMTREYEGNYSCELCKKDDRCEVTNASLLLLKETYLVNKTKAIAAPGGVFTHSCPTEETDKMDSPSTVKWTSESIGKPVITFTLHGRSAAKKPKDGKMLSNGSIYLSDVDSSDAGNYSCWVQRGPCHWIRLLTVNLYVRSGSLVENVNHGGLGQTTESWNQDAHEPQDKKDSSHKMVVISATLVTSLLALLLLCMVLHCRCRRSAEITSPNEQLHPEPSHRSTESSR
ncbi:uncharacterized protein LOC125749313 isoform X2 [Brienomyrus brachyistius]|nr:uncharacterized protein LOC125749313 isoform X2 [Brienomyrus brachyistius]